MERLLTFIDVDENRLELWLKPDRIQLVVIDSRPELEAGELRRFASAVFAEYVGRDAAAQLRTAQLRLRAARAACDACDGGDRPGEPDRELAAALDSALAALDELAVAVAVPAPESFAITAAELEPAPALEPDPDPEPAAPAPPRVLTGRVPYLPLKPSRRGKRACDSGSLVWQVTARGSR